MMEDDFSKFDLTLKISKTSIREIIESNVEANKSEDVKRLEEILGYINLFENGEITNIKDVFCKIGDLCEGITHNDKGDSGLYVIKNYYGYITRGKTIKNNKQVNVCGIYFEKYSQFKIYLEQEHLYQPIIDGHLEDLRNILYALKNSIVNILRQENYLIYKQRTAEVMKSMTVDNHLPVNISRVSDVYYNKIVFDRMSKELELVERINYDSLEGRYIFARVFTILGDLANDLVEDRINPTNNLVAALKNLFSIRSKIIHCFKKIQNDDSESIRINEEHISLVKDNLNNWISRFRGREGECLEIKNDDQPEIYQTLKNETNVLLKYFKRNFKKQQKESIPKKEQSIEKVKYNLNYLILIVDKIIQENISDKENDNQIIEDRLSHLNKIYSSLLKKLDATDKINFPPVLSLKNRSKINKHSRMNLLINPSKEKKFEKPNPYLESKIHDINKEMEYLESVESNRKIGHVEKEHIMEQICLEVTQYVREVEYGIVIPDFNIEDTDGQKDFPYESLLKKVLKESADNASFFTYLYTFTDLLNHPSISHIMMCNIGVSFAKLRLYKEASFYLEKSYNGIESFCEKLVLSEQSNMGDVRPDGRKPNYFFIVNFGIEWYQLFISRTYAKVLSLNNEKDKAKTIYDSTFAKLNFDNIKNFAEKNFKSAVTNFLIDFVNYLIEKYEFQRAIKITEQALTLSDDLQLQFILIEGLCKSNQFEQAKEFCDKILVDCQDVFLRMRILQRFVEIYVSCTEAECGITYAKIYLGEIERLFQSEKELFLETFNTTYKLTKLKIKYGELVLFIKNRCSESEFDNFEKMERECKELIEECRKSPEKDPIVAIILMIFCWIYSQSSKSISKNDHTLAFKLAKSFFREAAKEIDYFPNLLCLQTQVIVLLEFLTTKCSAVEDSGEEIKSIERFIEFFTLQNDYTLNKLVTLQKLIYRYEKLSQQYVLKFNDDSQIRHLEEALHCFKNIELLINLNKSERNETVIQRSLVLDNSSFYSLKNLAFCCEKIAESKGDMKYMKVAVKCFDMVLPSSVPISEIINTHQDNELLKEQIVKYLDFLSNLLYYNGPITNPNFNQQIIIFCNNTFNIELRSENGLLILDHPENMDQSSLLIRRELNSF